MTLLEHVTNNNMTMDLRGQMTQKNAMIYVTTSAVLGMDEDEKMDDADWLPSLASFGLLRCYLMQRLSTSDRGCFNYFCSLLFVDRGKETSPC